LASKAWVRSTILLSSMDGVAAAMSKAISIQASLCVEAD
jgi:hypothetical protein